MVEILHGVPKYPEGPGTSLFWNWGLTIMIVMAFGAYVLNNLVSGPSGK